MGGNGARRGSHLKEEVVCRGSWRGRSKEIQIKTNIKSEESRKGDGKVRQRREQKEQGEKGSLRVL